MNRRLSLTLLASMVTVAIAGCATAPSASPTGRFDGSDFAVPLTAEMVPGLLDPEVFADRRIRWVSARSDDHEIQFFAPLETFPWGSPRLPDDYLAYIERLSGLGAVYSDVSTITVDGRDASILTVSVPENLDGALGCWSAEPRDDGCVGFPAAQDVRFAVLDFGDTVLIASAATESGAADQAEFFGDFEAMVLSIDLL